MRKQVGWLAALAAACFTGQSAQASEGAASYYFPGAFGSFLVSVPPEPGLSIANQALLFGGNAQRAVINGRQTVGLQAFAFSDFVDANYTFEQTTTGSPPACPRAASAMARSSPTTSRPRTSSVGCCCARLRS
jgi:hypothetical protein